MRGLTVALLVLHSFSSGVLSLPTKCHDELPYSSSEPLSVSPYPYPSYGPSSVTPYPYPSSEPLSVSPYPYPSYEPSSYPSSEPLSVSPYPYPSYEPSSSPYPTDYAEPSAVYGAPTPSSSSTPYCPPIGSVQIVSVVYSGSGCPSDSIASTLSEDGTNVQLAFDSYYAGVGNDTTVASSASCQLTIHFKSPKGWSFSAYNTQYVGYVDLDDKVTAYQQSKYQFEGDSKSKTCTRHWTGELIKDYQVTDEFVRSTMVWSSYDETVTILHIDTQIGTDNSANPYGSGLITTDSINHKTTHNIGLEWNKVY